MSGKAKRAREVGVYVMVSREERELIRERMTEAGATNMGAFIRKMALNGYVLRVDLSPVKELVSLQRRCANNMNQITVKANSRGSVYKEDIADLRRDYAALWGPLADLIKRLAEIVRM